MRPVKLRTICLASWFFSSLAMAQPTLTPVGAVLEGNAEGTIPSWTGGLAADESRPNPEAWLADRFAADQPLLTLTSANYREHLDRLSAGHAAMFGAHPSFTMPVYATRRSVGFPQSFYEATQNNRGTSALRGADAITGGKAGIPFPTPRSGVEVMWNHRLRYKGDSAQWSYRRAYVNGNGHIDLSSAVERVLHEYGNVSGGQHMLSYTLTQIAPCESAYRLVHYLWHEPVNAAATQRRLWSWLPGVWRVTRNPVIGYDQAGYCSYLVRYFDMIDMFSGSFDRYTFKLLGKKELFVPYNSFRLSDPENRIASVVKPGHLEQALARYELHRVWVVEASLRPGSQHSISKRRFYVDEDSWSILLADCYDNDGALWRVQEGHLLPLYPVQGVDYAPRVTYDLKNGSYFVDRLFSEIAVPWQPMKLTRTDFRPKMRQPLE